VGVLPGVRKAINLLWAAALAVVVIQTMALATRYFQPWLDVDYLLSQRFADDVMGGTFPLSGWTLSLPFLFPDFALSILWQAALGGAPLLPFYVVTSYVSLALLAGWSLHHVDAADGSAWLAGALLVNVLLALQGTADHARWLWWLGSATFHGGAILLGLAQFAFWAGPARTAPSRRRVVTATVLLFVGLASDLLLLTQFVVPLGLALIMTADVPRWQAPRVRSFFRALFTASLLVVALRGLLLLADWWTFIPVVRRAPTPTAVAATAGRMASDLSGPVASAVPGFVVMTWVAGAAAVWLWMRRRRTGQLSVEQRQAGWLAAAGLGSTLLLPVLTVYWVNPQSGRYLLPCLILPSWCLLALRPAPRFRGPSLAGIAAGLLALAAWRAPEIRSAAWSWPYPERVAELHRFLAAEGRDRGLANFWHAHYLTTVTHSGVRLNQVEPDGRVQFWGNNAFHHFEADGAEARLRAPRYSFVVANDLDPVALRETFGAPSRIARLSEYEIWLYDEAGAQAMSDVVNREVRAFLGDRPGTERIGDE
jgi:hypothetical protein